MKRNKLQKGRINFIGCQKCGHITESRKENIPTNCGFCKFRYSKGLPKVGSITYLIPELKEIENPKIIQKELRERENKDSQLCYWKKHPKILERVKEKYKERYEKEGNGLKFEEWVYPIVSSKFNTKLWKRKFKKEVGDALREKLGIEKGELK